MRTQANPVAFALCPSADQAALLSKTLRRFNRATQYAVNFAVDHLVFSSGELLRVTGDALREDFSLTEHMATQVIAKGVDVCRYIPRVSGIPIIDPPHIGEASPMVVDLTRIEGNMAVLCLDAEERVRLEYVGAGRPGRNAGPAELVSVEGVFFLFIDAKHYPDVIAMTEGETRASETWRQTAMKRLGLLDTVPL